MVARFGDQLIPSLSAEMLRVAQGAGGHILKQAADTGTGVNVMRTGQVTISLDGMAGCRFITAQSTGSPWCQPVM